MEYWGRCLKHAYAISIVVLVHISASLSLFHHHANATRCVEKEREALLAIKLDLVDEYDRLSSWGSGNEAQKQDCCKWERVYCDNQTGHVLQLDLGSAYSSGKISPKLIELHHLTYLDLSGNYFNGSQIPSFIGSLTYLRHLDLYSAGFGGQIPYQLGNLTHLQYLNLGFNYFTPSRETLNWLPHLSSLKSLNMIGTNLSNVFDWLETVNKLPNLRNLTLTECGLPPPILSSSFSYINSSKSLAHVDLFNNSVTSSIFKWLCNSNTSLVHLQLSDNKLSGSLPDVFGNMSSLTYLDLSGNQLEGGIPDSFAKLCGLQYLDIRINNLSGHISNFFESLCAQNSLEFLEVSDNHLAGPFPDLTKFLTLKSLDLNRNHLSGTIPKSIGQMSKLEIINVNNNHLEGVISESHFSQLSKLWDLDLSSNSLALDFHSEWVPPFQLRSLQLGSCKMGPLFPKWIRTQKNLKSLTISDAGISDIIPSWFWDLSRNIFWMDLSRNEIKGTILADSGFELAYGTQGTQLNLSWNQLEGPIPSFLSKAESLYLSNNKLSKVDSFLCATNVSNLIFLDLSGNQLSGELPDCWKPFKQLVFLDLSNNTLSGNIPTTMGSLSSIETLKLDNNILEGELPSSMKNCTSLILFDLGENKLSGLIPKWLGVGLPNLAILILRSNHFNGSMPSQLCHLTSIQILDLSMNNISGSIPKCLNNLTTLAQKGSLDLTIRHRYTGGGTATFVGFYDDAISITWKGTLSKYKTTLGLVKSIDLSSNRLTGEIPSEITLLVGLVSLNLSRNHLTGHITSDIGKLQSLQSLDLSRNKICGNIPTSLLQIYGLGYLNLSDNNLSGKIPIGTQLQNYDPSSFAGNPQLCGLLLARTCDPEGTGRPNIPSNQEDSDELITHGFYISLGLGFVVGFWGVCGSLIFKRSWRYAYYKFLNASNDWLYVKVALIRQKLKDVLNL